MLGRNDGGGYGNYVIIQETKTGRCFLYAHLKGGTIKVKKGDSVSVGTSIAIMGSSGDSGHMHLHFEIRTSKANTVYEYWNGTHGLVNTKDSTTLDPEKYIGSEPREYIENLASEDKLKTVGDLNANGNIDIQDASICSEILAKMNVGYKFDDYVIKYADMNGDGKVTISDVSMILLTYARRAARIK